MYNRDMTYLLEGNISVKAALSAGRRNVLRVFCDEKKNDRDTLYILHLAEKMHVPVEMTDRETIDAMASGKSHGGLVCEAEERAFQSWEDLRNKDFLCLLEGIEDPFNFAYCLRSLYAAGCQGILVPERNWYTAAAEILRSSAGAAEYLDVVQSADLSSVIRNLKGEYRVIAAERKDAVSLYDADLTQPLILCIGGEKRGLSKSVMQLTDMNVYIPYSGQFRNALNASGATSVCAFEILRQRSRKI